MKKIQELHEIAELSIQSELSDQESAIVEYFKGHKDYLISIFSQFSTSDQLSIISFITKGNSVLGSINLNNSSFVSDHPEVHELLIEAKLVVALDPKEIELLKSKGIEEVEGEVTENQDRLIAGLHKTNSHNSLDSKIKGILGKSGSRLVNLRNNVAMTSALMLGTAMFSSCNPGDISAKVNYKTQPIISLPAVDQITGDFSLSFANHSASAVEEDELTAYKISETMLIQVPKVINQLTYQSDRSKPTLTLTANGQYVCSYIWVDKGQSNPNALDNTVAASGEYRMHKSCFQEIETNDGMVISVENIPKAKTVTLKFSFEK